ncbi:unnamed protein product, partial [Prorocentrum cordatum]
RRRRRRRRRQGDKTPAGRQLGAAPGCSRPCRRVAGADAPSARAGPCACARGAVPTGEEGADGGAQRSGICLYLATTSTSSSSQPRKYLTSSPRLRGADSPRLLRPTPWATWFGWMQLLGGHRRKAEGEFAG